MLFSGQPGFNAADVTIADLGTGTSLPMSEGFGNYFQDPADVGPFEWESNGYNTPQPSPTDTGPFLSESDAWNMGPFMWESNDYGTSIGPYLYESPLFDSTPYVPSSSDMATIYGNAGYGGESAKDYQGNDFLKKYREGVSGLQPILKNPIISTLMSLNPATAALKTILGGPNSVGGFLGSLLGNQLGGLGGALLGGVGGSQLANYATTGQFAPMTSQSLGSLFGTGIGAMTGNPYGAAIGNYLGGQVGGFAGNQSPGMSSQNMLAVPQNNSMLEALVAGGLGYNANKQLNSQIGSLQGLYGQDSSYAQAMRQQLDRRDAAAGRRSQYGPREVELQALLAGNAARLAPSLQQLYTQKTNNTNLIASTLLNNLMKNPNIFSGLGSLFGGASTSAPDPFVGGGFHSGNEGMGD